VYSLNHEIATFQRDCTSCDHMVQSKGAALIVFENSCVGVNKQLFLCPALVCSCESVLMMFW
jgi:hypothetical protein